ncbi:MAG: Hpt domain-containing protein [Desulfuromonadaceae bacterium]|nr:Hpt domain-containing protein [Desulfuromonadaceae bacterium]MDD2855846.1 Hpt domain-containing protein [Desulfuromonadaceae bacterium]
MSENPIIVEIESELEPIVPEFLENRKKDCQRIEGLLESENFGEIRTLGHRMKGAGGSYGFDEISVIGEAIEMAALTGDKETISRSIVLLDEYIQRVVVVYV